MRKAARSALILGVSAALIAPVTMETAEARSKKELNLCWTSRPLISGLNLNITADGPSFRQRNFKSGECKAYDVRPGQYKMVVKNLDDVAQALGDSGANQITDGTEVCGALPAGMDFWERRLVAKVRRFNKTYTVNNSHSITDSFVIFFLGTGGVQSVEPTFVTNVKKDRRTSVSYSVKCHAVDI